jgi:Flp pilus assembly protein TadG
VAQQVHRLRHVLKHLWPRVRRWFRHTSGTSLAEAALITPVLAFMTFAIVDFAMLFYA